MVQKFSTTHNTLCKKHCNQFASSFSKWFRSNQTLKKDSTERTDKELEINECECNNSEPNTHKAKESNQQSNFEKGRKEEGM